MSRIILAVDPGKKTGIAVFAFDGTEPELLKSDEVMFSNYDRLILFAMDLAKEQGHDLDIVCERFVINAQTVKNSQAPFSLEHIGILKYLMLVNGYNPETKLVMQAPVDAKRMFPNEALKKLGYWHVGGEGHALDAIRHGLLRLVKTGWKPTRLLQ